MRTIRRMVIILGCMGFIALYLLQYSVALAVTPLILVVGALTGLVVAKWLPWAWYGRQFAAGVRAGIVTCGLAGAGVLLSLVGSGSPSVTTLAAKSRLPGFDLTQLVASVGSLGWFTPYVLLTGFFAIVGVFVAGVLAQIFGWSKSVRTVRVIKQAHDAAASLHRSQTWAPASTGVPSVGGYWNAALSSIGPASHPSLAAQGVAALAGHPLGTHATHAPVSGTPVARTRGPQEMPLEQSAAYLAPLPLLEFDEPVVAEPPRNVPEPIPLRRTNSGVQAIQAAMTDDLRSALDHWDDNAASEPTADGTDSPKKTSTAKKSSTTRSKTPTKRQPKASAYLNSDPPATPRRSRKKQDTRDWLC